MSRRQLIGLVAVVAALLIVGIDGLAVHHFGKNAATKTYPDNYLNAVACPSTAQCWAVGQTATAPGGNTLAEPRHPLLKHETAGHWSTVIVAAPGPKDALEAIACPGVTDCWAVGGSATSGQPLMEHWAGGTWQPAPSPAVRGGQLDAISCASPDACWATGGTQAHSGVTGDLIEHWNGSAWAIVTSVAGGLQPQQFSCPERGYCLTLGVRDGTAAAAAYSAGRWTAVAPPTSPAGGAGSTAPSLFGCTGPAMCLAAYDGTKLVTDVWNGRTWTPVSSSALIYPVGLTCSSGKGCWLLGMTRKHKPLALRWQQNDWVAMTAPVVRHSGYLSGLACGSSCWAVGGVGGNRRNGDPYTRPLIAPLA
jgi:hypothetical protein